MKKYITLILLIILYLTITKCTPQKQTAYVVPDTITGESRIAMVKLLEAGQTLYKLNCSRCHGIFTKGKDGIPNFSKTQIETYKASALLDDPKNHSVAQKVRPEDLEKILEFLTYRKQAEVK